MAQAMNKQTRESPGPYKWLLDVLSNLKLVSSIIIINNEYEHALPKYTIALYEFAEQMQASFDMQILSYERCDLSNR
jgi:hypothetical protein